MKPMHEQYLLTIRRWLRLRFKGEKASAKTFTKFHRLFVAKYRGPRLHTSRAFDSLSMQYQAHGVSVSRIDADLDLFCSVPGEAQRAWRASLADAYVMGLILRRSNISADRVPPALIELKREQLSLHRLGRGLKQEITNQLEKQHGN